MMSQTSEREVTVLANEVHSELVRMTVGTAEAEHRVDLTRDEALVLSTQLLEAVRTLEGEA